MKRTFCVLVIAAFVLAASSGPMAAQAQSTPPQTAPPVAPQVKPQVPAKQDPKKQDTRKPDPKKDAKTPAKPSVAPTPIVRAPVVPPPPGYVIGPDDILQVLYWREKDVSAEVIVRPDGMISLPLLNDVQAAGLTPEQLRDKVNEAAKKFFEDPNVTINIKQINSRKVFITGSVAKPGPYPLTAATSVLQLIAMAGGLTEFADQKNITIMRTENGRQLSFAFNYKDVTRRKNLKQNIELKPGDTVIVP
ncbi:MAG TPA: polysaccharide biosynthesis/export family protein [Vicinamibacterales bacterium]|jgi:polysaccharide export outer membrane protein